MVSSIASGDVDGGVELLHLFEPVDGLLAQFDAGGGEGAQGRLGLGHRPGAVGVQADLHVGAGDGAHGGDAAGVVADRRLELDRAESGLAGGRRFGGRSRPVGGGDRGVDLDLRGGLRAEQVPYGQAGSATREIPQREVDRG